MNKLIITIVTSIFIIASGSSFANRVYSGVFTSDAPNEYFGKQFKMAIDLAADALNPGRYPATITAWSDAITFTAQAELEIYQDSGMPDGKGLFAIRHPNGNLWIETYAWKAHISGHEMNFEWLSVAGSRANGSGVPLIAFKRVVLTSIRGA